MRKADFRRESRKNIRKSNKQLKKRRRAYQRQSAAFFLSDEWKHLRGVVFKQLGNRCLSCGHPGSPDNGVCIDHVIPRCRRLDLERDITNLQVLCRVCNEAKGRAVRDYRTPAQIRKLMDYQRAQE